MLADPRGTLTQAHSILDDLFHNIISDIVMKTHREEKTAKANTAAIHVEKLASDASETNTPESNPDIRIETDAAIYEDGQVLLKGNPLKTTTEILCPKCRLPRLFYPTDGKGSRKPDPTVLYCKKHPYIQKPGCDIYGQSWVAQGPGRGKKKKDMEKDAPTTAESRPPNVLSFPSATCSKCKRCILVTRLNNHMGSCIGNSGRNASRAAAHKMSNGGSQNDTTPPSSQKATPAPASRASSPKKRDASEEGDESEGSQHKKKKVKSANNASTNGNGNANPKKVILKKKNPLKKEVVKGGSGLSQEQKPDDVGSDKASSPVAVPPKKLNPKASSPVKKLKASSKPMIKTPLQKNAKELDGESDTSGAHSSPPSQR